MSDRNYRLNRFRGGWAIVWNEPDGSRPRHKIDAADRKEAERLLERFKAERSKPEHITVRWLWERYRQENAAKPITVTMDFTGRSILPVFGDGRPDDVTVEACRNYTAARRAAGIKDGTIWTQLNHLQVVLNWAVKRRFISERIHVDRPSKPPPRDRRLTKREAKRLLDAATMPHIQLAIALMLGTAARKGAILDLTWDRVDLEQGLIVYALADGKTRKGRATVPIAPDLHERLSKAKQAALTDHVIEWAGKPVGSLKRAFETAVTKAGLTDVSPHVLRHTAASWMAQAGVPMTEIAAVLGHTDSRVTERIYAKFSPAYLRRATAVLDMSEVPGSSLEPEAKIGNERR